MSHFSKTFFLLILLVSCSSNKWNANQSIEPITPYPEVSLQNPGIPSPYFSSDGEEYVTAITKDDKYAIINVTLRNNRDFKNQLVVDSIDFPILARTGLHDPSQLSLKSTITGREISEITRLGRPGNLSHSGFMAEDETILSVMSSDNILVSQMGLTHPELAKPLFHILNQYLKPENLTL